MTFPTVVAVDVLQMLQIQSPTVMPNRQGNASPAQRYAAVPEGVTERESIDIDFADAQSFHVQLTLPREEAKERTANIPATACCVQENLYLSQSVRPLIPTTLLPTSLTAAVHVVFQGERANSRDVPESRCEVCRS